jgi:predicted AlkP superfamily pyrophosphatase or phosphodiesterase
MKWILRFLLLFVLAGGCQLGRSAEPASTQSDLLILISIDGFRWDYLQKYDAPALNQLARDGVHARRLTPSFPSKTYPNHYTLVTGLYPEHHGIVANAFYDPEFKETFDMGKAESNHEARWWSGGEPVWIAAERQGVRSACYFWPGSEVEFAGRRPEFFPPFDKRIPINARVDGLLAWLDLPAAQRPRFCTLYFELVDHAGHTFGPDSAQTATAVKQADNAIARLLTGLASRGLRDKTDLVIVSDHGMAPTGPNKVIFIEDLMDVSQVQVESTGPVAGVRPKSGDAATLAASIRAKKPAHLQVYLRKEMPERFHYRASERISPVVLVADLPWNIESKIGWPLRAPSYNVGSHGWDPAEPEMGALFIASGPSFKHGDEFDAVDNIHVYNLLCAVLGIQPAPNDGDNRLVREALLR